MSWPYAVRVWKFKEAIMSENKYDVEIIRHSLAHVMAAAVKKLYPDVKFGGGPAIENGFYYDFDTEHRFSEGDFEKIEKEMRALIKSDGRFVRQEVSLEEAKEIFADQPYKMEWLNEYDAAGDALSVYEFRGFVDLCRGPHVESSKELPRDAFKIRSVAGAYWRGDSKNKMLQRIYVDAFETAAELDAHLKMMEEAAKRDNRKLGREMDLFHFDSESAQGMIFWHPKGYRIFLKLVEYLRIQQAKLGFQEIYTPMIMDRGVWETSGHWQKFSHHNYTGTALDGREFCVKPVSCPGGIMVFKQGIKSYKDLPIAYSEFGFVHRYEASGGLGGLLRLRGFTQNDTHVFCTEEQAEPELIRILDFTKKELKKFGFKNLYVMLATRPDPDKRIGSDEVWDKTEAALANAADKSGIPYKVAEKDGAMYGPKLDIYVSDSMGREWTIGTVQFDMSLPERFDLSYMDENGEKQRPVMIHCAPLGAIERFIGLLLESTGGNLPLWLSPEPVVVTPVSEKYDDYANQLVTELRAVGVWARADLRSEKVNYKIRELSIAKTPIIAVVGEKEVADKTVTLRHLGAEGQETKSMIEFIKDMVAAVKMPE